jgi:hypothetical protein
VQEFGRRESYSPSYREIAEAFGLAVSTVSHHAGVASRDVFSADGLAQLRGFPEIGAKLIRFFILAPADEEFVRRLRDRRTCWARCSSAPCRGWGSSRKAWPPPRPPWWPGCQIRKGTQLCHLMKFLFDERHQFYIYAGIVRPYRATLYVIDGNGLVG